LVAVCGADPLNLVGIITPGDPVAALAGNRILFRDGVPVAVQEGESRQVRLLAPTPDEDAAELKSALIRRRAAPLVRAYLAKR
jgi:ATP-dependent Lhr-like helicase